MVCSGSFLFFNKILEQASEELDCKNEPKANIKLAVLQLPNPSPPRVLFRPHFDRPNELKITKQRQKRRELRNFMLYCNLNDSSDFSFCLFRNNSLENSIN